VLLKLGVELAEFGVVDMAQPLAGVVEGLGGGDTLGKLLVEVNKEGAAGLVFDIPEGANGVAGSAAEAGADQSDVFVVKALVVGDRGLAGGEDDEV
jgi:hypothetical protein